MKDKKLFLRSVHVDEALVQDHMDQAVDVFKLNTVGPQKYAEVSKLWNCQILFYNNYNNYKQALYQVFKSAEVQEREIRLNVVFFGLKIQSRCEGVRIVKCANISFE